MKVYIVGSDFSLCFTLRIKKLGSGRGRRVGWGGCHLDSKATRGAALALMAAG